MTSGGSGATHWSSCEADEGNFALQTMAGESDGREHIAQLLLHIHTQLQLAEVSRRVQSLRKVWTLNQQDKHLTCVYLP